EAMVERGIGAMSGSTQWMPGGHAAAPAKPHTPNPAPAPAKAAPAHTHGTLINQTLERPLRPGEVSLDELERAFRETSVEVEEAPKAAAPAPVAPAPPPAARESVREARKEARPKEA